MGEFRSTLPPWIARVSENATESVARWEGLKIETIGVAHIIKVGSFHQNTALSFCVLYVKYIILMLLTEIGIRLHLGRRLACTTIRLSGLWNGSRLHRD